MTTKTQTKLVPLVITTAHKGVFFGYGDPDGLTKDGDIRLEKVRMCVYWSNDVKGSFGLAASGPTESCKIGLAVSVATLRGVTAILHASPEAAVAWEAHPWKD